MWHKNIFFAIFALIATNISAVPTVSIKGLNFVNSLTGSRFNIVGVAYQPAGSSGYNPSSGIDPLSDGDVCLRDAALMQSLGVNAVRVYNVDPKINHDLCASIFNQVGIYLMIDVNSPLPGESLNRLEPWASYYAGYVERTFAVVEAFKNYPNTLLFFVGNEVISDVATGQTVPPYLRAMTRDLKNYIAKNSKRKIPVGYSAADVRENLFDTWNYLQCTINGDILDPSRADFFALNSYSWCGDSNLQKSGYDQIVAGFSKTSQPVFFSEYGCNVPAPRIFTEVPALYGPEVSSVLSGAVAYEFSQEPSDYGLVELGPDGSAKLRSDFETLQSQIRGLDAQAIQGGTIKNSTLSPPACNPSLIKTSGFNKDFTIPDVPPGVQELIDQGIPNAPLGKIISVMNTKVSQKVQRSNGDLIKDLAIKPLSDQNGGGNPTNSDTPSFIPPAPKSTSTKPALAAERASSVATPIVTPSKVSGSEHIRMGLGALLGTALLVLWLL